MKETKTELADMNNTVSEMKAYWMGLADRLRRMKDQ